MMNQLKNVATLAGRKIRKHSDVILLGAGLIGTAGTVVLACRSTLGVEEIIAKKREGLKAIEDFQAECMENGKEEDYPKDEVVRHKTIVYTKCVCELIKLYLPAIAAGAISVTSILCSFKIVKGRNAALATTLAATMEGFKAYRDRVEERYGKEAEEAVYYNLKEETITETVTDENGKEKKVKKKVEVLEGEPGAFTYRFDAETSDFYDSYIDRSLGLLKDEENAFNSLVEIQNSLRKKNFVFLNDVFDRLGMSKTKEGQMIGWVFDPYNDQENKKIDFGIRLVKEKSDSYQNGYKDVIMLNFNCDGYIIDQM